jgi:hypothetical protein
MAGGPPVRVGLIGAGKFGSMFLSQVPTIRGLEVAVIADLDPDRARLACHRVGWEAARIERTASVASGNEACGHPDVDVVVEATGSPAAGIAHARAAVAAGKHIVMVNVEADVLAGPLLAAEARSKGVVYSLAYGDQPALTCELVDWARACGFEVVAAGKGTKYLPAYHTVTPDDVWAHYGLTPEEARRGGMNPQMFNSFLDGTKSAIEMAAIANATGLAVPANGLGFPPCGVDDLPHVLRATEAGGVLEQHGMVEVVSSLEARRPSDIPRSALGRVRRAESAKRIRQSLFQGVRAEDRRQRLVCRDVQALPSDRPGARHLRALSRLASGAHRASGRFPRRCRRRRKAGAVRRRDARWRRRLYRLGQAGAGGTQPARTSAANRLGEQCQALTGAPGRPDHNVAGRGNNGYRRGSYSSRDGTPVLAFIGRDGNTGREMKHPTVRSL